MKSNEIVIEPGKRLKHYWQDIWQYKELFYFLAWRDILVRYKQTFLGIAWAVLRPFLTMVVFTIIFGKLAQFPSHGVPYPILVFAAMLPWQFFAGSLAESSNSMIQNTSMVSKVYFPRMIIPSSSIAVNFVDFLISFTLLVLLMFWYQFLPSWQILTVPLFLLIAAVAALGAGLWFSALNVRYRDFRYVVPFVVQFGLYISPVGFSSAVIPEKWRLLYSLNPMVGVIDGFRWAVLGQDVHFYWPGFLLSLALVCFLFASGLWYFRRVERYFADVI